MWMNGGHSMLRPLEPAIGGPLTKALNKAYWNASRLQSVQDREKSSGPGVGHVLPPRRSPLRPTSLRRSTLRSYRRAIECRDGVPFDRFARQWLLQHTPIGDEAQQAWTSPWGRLFTDEETDAPGPQLELELSLRAAWDQERQRLEVATRSQRACEASEEKKYRLRELHLANGKRRRRLLQARREGRAAAQTLSGQLRQRSHGLPRGALPRVRAQTQGAPDGGASDSSTSSPVMKAAAPTRGSRS
jgi:hypothetical protein